MADQQRVLAERVVDEDWGDIEVVLKNPLDHILRRLNRELGTHNLQTRSQLDNTVFELLVFAYKFGSTFISRQIELRFGLRYQMFDAIETWRKPVSGISTMHVVLNRQRQGTSFPSNSTQAYKALRAIPFANEPRTLEEMAHMELNFKILHGIVKNIIFLLISCESLGSDPESLKEYIDTRHRGGTRYRIIYKIILKTIDMGIEDVLENGHFINWDLVEESGLHQETRERLVKTSFERGVRDFEAFYRELSDLAKFALANPKSICQAGVGGGAGGAAGGAGAGVGGGVLDNDDDNDELEFRFMWRGWR